jgi:hypothetical protein
LVVLRPEHDWNYENFRLFLGPSNNLEERQVTNATRALDGGSTWIMFQLSGHEATAFFPHRLLGPDTIQAEPATLEAAGTTRELRLLSSAASDLDGVSFVCSQ